MTKYPVTGSLNREERGGGVSHDQIENKNQIDEIVSVRRVEHKHNLTN